VKLPRRNFLRLVAGGAALPAISRTARAQAYPTRPVRIIVGFAAGSASDIIARLIGQRLSELLGQPFVVENRGGAGGTLGAEAVAHASPDGYMLLLSGSQDAVTVTLYENLIILACSAERRFQAKVAPQQICATDVSLGSKADIEVRPTNVCFTPKSGHRRVQSSCPLCAKSRLSDRFSIRHEVAKPANAYRDLPPAFLHSDLNFLRCSPCKPLALAWSLQDFAIVFF
jgi:hypothetical protein